MWGVSFWGLREALPAQGRLSFPMETLQKADALSSRTPSPDGPGWPRGRASHPGSHISAVGSLPADLGAQRWWVGRGFGGKSTPSAVFPLPTWRLRKVSWPLQQDGRNNVWVLTVVEPKEEEEGRPESLKRCFSPQFAHPGSGLAGGWGGGDLWSGWGIRNQV